MQEPDVAAVRRRSSWAAWSLLAVPLCLLMLGAGCHHSSSPSPNDPGKPPVIQVNPVSAATVSGRSVGFSVVVTGAPTLAYQWTKNGSSIYGAWGSTYTLANPAAQDSGTYAVTVTNPVGTVTSPSVTLTVATAVRFHRAMGLAIDAAGNIFVSDVVNHAVWKVDTAHQTTLLAGGSGFSGSADGKGSNARFDSPGNLAFEPSGSLVLADTGNHTIRRIAMDGTVTTLAGAAGQVGTQDGVGALARFNAPYGIAVNATGVIFVADTLNHTIRRLATDGTVSTVAGQAGQSGYADGSAGTALFNQPNGLALAPDGTCYIVDYGNSCIRTLTSAGQVAILAGQARTPGFVNGTGTAALLSLPVGLAWDATGRLWVADTHNHAIRTLTAQGALLTVAGSGAAGDADGTGSSALFNLPCAVAVTPDGNAVVADTSNGPLRLVTPAGVTTTLTLP